MPLEDTLVLQRTKIEAKYYSPPGGDIANQDGTGEDSALGGLWDDENFILKNYGAGWLGMANRGQ